MRRYQIRSLGHAAIIDAQGQPVDLPTGKPFATLLYIALADRAPTREDLAAMLWPAAPRARAFQSLRQTLLQLRQSLGDDVLIENATLRLNTTVVSVDVVEFRRAIEQGDLDAADKLWEGAFCDRYAIAGAPEWQHWADQLRRDLAARFGRLLSDRARDARVQHLHARAAALLKRAIEIEPFELRHRAGFVRSLIDAGQIGEAMSVLAEARREFGDAEFRAELDALEQEIQAAGSHWSGQREQSLLKPEFVGRAAELAMIRDVWRRAEQGQAGIVTIAGNAGVGKTRLAEEACQLAGAAARVVTVKSTEPERRIEWGTVGSLIRELRRLRGASGVSAASERVLRALLPSQDSAATIDIAPIQPTPLADAVSDLIDAVVYEGPLVILLDDFHWADDLSRSLLVRVLRETRAQRVLYLVTFRFDDLTRDVQRGLDALERVDNTRPLRIAPLSRADVAELLAGFIDLERGAAAISAIDRIFAATEGHPLFIVELLQAFAEDGLLEYRERGWSLDIDRLPAQLALPNSLRTLIDRRLDRVTPEALQVLAALSREPAKAHSHELRNAARLSEDEFTPAVIELIDREILRWNGNVLAFTHDTIREAVYWRTRYAYGRPGSRTRVLGVVAAVLATLLLGGWAIQRYLNVPPRWGGGQLLVGLGDSTIVLEPVGRGSKWRRTQPRDWILEEPNRQGPFLKPDGGWRWFYNVNEASTSPYPVEAFRDGSRRVIAKRHREDTNLAGLSPDGAWLTFTQDQPDTTKTYDLGLFLARADGSDAVKLYQGGSIMRNGKWSPDGNAIALVVSDKLDTLLVLTPRGERVKAVTIPTIGTVDWCGPAAVLASVWRDEHQEFALIRLDGSADTILALGPHSRFACSPDGTAFVYVGIRDGRWAVFSHDLRSGKTEPVPLSAGATATTLLSWAPDGLSPFATRLTIRAAPDSLRAGERRRLQTDVQFSDGKARPARVRWESKNVSIVSVDSTGLVIGNQSGVTEIVATAAGWRSDSVQIHVTSAARGAIALEDRFDILDTIRWYIVGQPAPRIRKQGSESWLQLTGDGNFPDGIISREAFELTTGATLELEFRIGLSRIDRQYLNVGLVIADVVKDGDPHNSTDWDWRSSVDFRYPAIELEKFDPAISAFSANGLVGRARVDKLLVPNDWNHLAIQVRADGHASVYLNRKFLAESPLPATVKPGERWRVVIQGAALDTELLVRNAALWKEPRH